MSQMKPHKTYMYPPPNYMQGEQIMTTRQLPRLPQSGPAWTPPSKDSKLWPLVIASIGAVTMFMIATHAYAGGERGGVTTVGGATNITVNTPPTVSPDVSAFGGGGGTGVGGSVVGVSQSVTNKAFGGGSTGLTGSARCLQSVGLAFNAISFTFRDGDCLAQEAAERFCKTDECKKKVFCQDKDLPAYAKEAIGC